MGCLSDDRGYDMKITSQAELDAVRKKCRKLVTGRSFAAGASSAVPGAVVGVAADVGLLMEMLPRINREFGLSAEQIDELDEQLRQQVFVLIGNAGASMIGRAITKEMVMVVIKGVGLRVTAKSAASYVPFIGSGISALLGFGMMKLVGHQHIEECYRVAQQMLPGRPGDIERAAA